MLRLRPLLVAAVLLAGCSPADDWSEPHAKPVAVGTLGPGFIDKPPAPEATITPRPGSWDAVRPSKGYRVVLLTTSAGAATRTLERAVATWAQQEDVSLKTVVAGKPDQFVSRIVSAMDLRPDLIVATGNALVDPLALVTANHLDQQFLVVGAELAEPTHNVTAADWLGASFRGEGLDVAAALDPATFTHERATRAVRAGIAAVLHGLTGIVVRVS